MAESKDNIITHGLSGTVANMVTFTQRAGKTVVGKKRKASTLPPSEEQVQVQEKFKIASSYAKGAIADPATKAAYKAAAKPGVSAYNTALADAFTPPQIGAITTTGYHGLVGDKIIIRATDDFKVEIVRVKITNAAGLMVEQGNAVMLENGLDWSYTATIENDAVAGSKITVDALDLPANLTTKEVVLA